MERLRRVPFRCRGCGRRFYVYVPVDKDEAEPAAVLENQPAQPDPDAVKPAE